MSSLDNLSKEIAKSVRELNESGTSPYDTQAKVVRVQDNTAWVHIPGGVDETPVQRTTNANAGDDVQVRVSGGRAWLVGNYTSPPTDDTVANEANENARIAGEVAEAAINSANEAADAAARANASAEEAKVSADEAAGEAVKAQTQAQKSSDQAAAAAHSAHDAHAMLGEVERVVDALQWIQEHAIFAKTTDTTVNPEKWYYAVTGQSVTNPSEYDFSTGRYYILQSGTYVKATETFDPTATYYTLTANITVPPTDSDPSAMGLYEIESYDQTVRNYISTYLAVDESGLHVGNKRDWSNEVLINSSGLDIVANGRTISHYGEDAIIGDPYGYNVYIANGIYQLTTDTQIDPDKTTAKQVSNPVQTDFDNGLYYILENNLYVKATGTFDPAATYYTMKGYYQLVDGDYIYVNNPTRDSLTSYYEYFDSILAFRTADIPVAYIDKNELYIPKVVVVDSMRIGYWMWDAMADPLHLTLKWVGE